MRVGVLTGGGDCPGLNAVIRAVVRKGSQSHGFEFVGYRDGWKGPLEGLTMELGVEQCGLARHHYGTRRLGKRHGDICSGESDTVRVDVQTRSKKQTAARDKFTAAEIAC